MSTLQDHKLYIKEKGDFIVDCSHAIFSRDELQDLKKYGHWYQALANGVLKPITDSQSKFVMVATNQTKPITPAEWNWFRYSHRKALEEKPGNALNANYKIEEDTFYNRAMAKKLKGMMFNEMNKNHNII